MNCSRGIHLHVGVRGIMRIASLAAGLILIVAIPASAQVKKWVDKEGTIHLKGEGPARSWQPPPGETQLAESQRLAFGDITDFVEADYLHIQGVIKNPSSSAARWVKVTVKILDGSGKLKRVEDTYASPYHIPGGGESTFTFMVPASPAYKKYEFSATSRR
jgi:hypothetical protein